MTTKLTKQEMAAIDKGPRTKRETEQWVALFERGLASGQLTLGKMSRKEQLKFREELVLTFWQLGEMEKGSLVIRLRALEELSQIVSTAKTRLLEKAAVAGGSHE